MSDFVRRNQVREQISLDQLAYMGQLKVREALNGSLYAIEMADGDFPIAAVTLQGVVIRSGDKVTVARGLSGGGTLQETVRVGEFWINASNGEIQMKGQSSSILRFHDITDNVSAVSRADKAERLAART